MSNEMLFAAVERENGLSLEQRIKQVRQAIAAGAGVNARGKYGFTPLHYAVERPSRASVPPPDLELVTLLIELGADVNAENDHGVRPLDYAIALNDSDPPATIEMSKRVIALLRAHGGQPGQGSPTSHHVCCDPSLYKMLLELNDDIRTADEDGNPPLHQAVMAQRPAIVEILLDRGAAIDAVNTKGKTPLALALKGDQNSPEQRKHKQQIIEILKARGAAERAPRAAAGTKKTAFETLEYADADERYGIEQYVEAPFLDDAEVRVYADDAQVDGNFDISKMGNCLFLKDLKVTGNILNSSDGDGPVFLIVLGNCTAKNMFIYEPLVCIQKQLTTEGGIIAGYNHGLLRVRGDVVTTILCAEHQVWVSGTIRGVVVDQGGLHVRDESFSPTVELDRYLVEDLLPEGKLDTEALRKKLEGGEPVLKSSQLSK